MDHCDWAALHYESMALWEDLIDCLQSDTRMCGTLGGGNGIMHSERACLADRLL